MNESTIQPWWVPALRGMIAIAFGLLALSLPGLTLLGLITLFAAYALFNGAVAVLGAMKKRRRDDNWWLLLLLGLASIGAGAVALIHPMLTALVLVLLIGATALMTGVLDIAEAIRLRKAIQGEWLLVLSGAMSVLFGALIFLLPGAGMLVLLWLIGIHALLTGALLLTVAFRLRGRKRARLQDQLPEQLPRMERRIMPDRRVAPAH